MNWSWACDGASARKRYLMESNSTTAEWMALMIVAFQEDCVFVPAVVGQKQVRGQPGRYQGEASRQSEHAYSGDPISS